MFSQKKKRSSPSEVEVELRPLTVEETERIKTGVIPWKAMRNWRYWVTWSWFCKSFLLLLTTWLSPDLDGSHRDLLRNRHPHVCRFPPCHLSARESLIRMTYKRRRSGVGCLRT